MVGNVNTKTNIKIDQKQNEKIYVVNWEVSFVSNEKNYDGNGSIKTWYKYSCILFNYNCKDYISEDFLITFIDEQKTSQEKHQNIYYDDNWEEIKRMRLGASNDSDKRIQFQN